MAPARWFTADAQQDSQLQSLARAFEALLITTQQLGCKERVLQRRLEYAFDEYSKLADRLPNGPDTHTKVISEKIRGRYSEFEISPKPPLDPPDVVKGLAESGSVEDTILINITEGLACYKTILHTQGVDRLLEPSPCLVATRAGVAGSLEKDFTTKGTQGRLRCPFAKSNNKPSENGVPNEVESTLKSRDGDSCGHEVLDPIKAEQNDRCSSQTASAAGTASTTRCPVSRCPIRYLDQHSPEEVANYVQRHKHEIPRSHAICVQRYQKDSSSMRQLDAKYGNLISMIRGLSVKHQAFLPNHTSSDGPTSNSSVERVEKWAEEVSSHPSIKEEEESDERKGHFDRPLREIRVGESPSRPWGIPVPLANASALQSPAAPVPAPFEHRRKPSDHAPVDASSTAPIRNSSPNPPAPAPKLGRCPFGHGAPSPPAQPAPEQAEPDIETLRNQNMANEIPPDAAGSELGKPPDGQGAPNKPRASIVFNGPVFFGYSPEQTALFLQQLGMG